MTKKEATNKFWLNLLVATPLGAVLFGGFMGWLLGPTIGIITVVIQIVVRVYCVFKEYGEDMAKINGDNYV